MQHAAATAQMLQEILAGCTSPDPAQHGMTTEEERAASKVQVGWGGFWLWLRCAVPLAGAHTTTAAVLLLVLLLQWPGCLDAVKPPNAGLRLFGGAAFERCLNEFQVAASMLAFPQSAVARDRVANVLLAYKVRHVPCVLLCALFTS